MLVLVQWATDPPGGWRELDSRDWCASDRKPAPGKRVPIRNGAGQALDFEDELQVDAAPGWVQRVCVQGVGLAADHLAVVHQEQLGCVDVHAWHDHASDEQPDAHQVLDRWRFYPGLATSERRVPGGVVTMHGPKLLRTVWTDCEQLRADLAGTCTTAGEVEVRAWSDRPRVPADCWRHGVYLPDLLHAQHLELELRSWREWEGLEL